MPHRERMGENVKNCQFFALASESCTNCSSKKEELFTVCTVVDAMMATIFFLMSIPPLLSPRVLSPH